MIEHTTGTDIGPPCECESTIYLYEVRGTTTTAKCMGCHNIGTFTFDHWPDIVGNITGKNMRKAHWRSSDK